MFKKYKIRKEKEKSGFKINSKKINLKDINEEKNEIYKLKTLFYNRNKKNAFKRILNMPKHSFDENLYYITINTFSEALNEINSLVKECMKKIANSEKFFMVEDIAIRYLKNFTINKEILELFNRKLMILKYDNNITIDIKKLSKPVKINFDEIIQLIR